MVDPKNNESNKVKNEFLDEAESGSTGLIREYLDMIRYYKKWWMLPPIAALLIFGVLLVLGGTSLAPVIYALF